jgi:hypothetical protein
MANTFGFHENNNWYLYVSFKRYSTPVEFGKFLLTKKTTSGKLLENCSERNICHVQITDDTYLRVQLGEYMTSINMQFEYKNGTPILDDNLISELVKTLGTKWVR